MTSFTSSGHNFLSGIFILASLNDTSSPRAPVLMLHLPNPCAKRKVLSLTKPKGKIYKTNSLGHYITVTGNGQLPSFLSLATCVESLSFLTRSNNNKNKNNDNKRHLPRENMDGGKKLTTYHTRKCDKEMETLREKLNRFYWQRKTTP